MKRRDIIAGASAVAIGAGTIGALTKSSKTTKTSDIKRSDLASPALSINRREFKLATSWPKDFPGLGIMPVNVWIDHGGGQALWDELSANFNIKAFQAGNSGHQTGGWFKKEINSVGDFRGLKMRMPGLGGDVLREIGAAAINLPGGEIYQSLQSGAIDATEWVGPWNDLAFGFYREAPYYYAPGFHEPGASLALGVNLDVWNSLSKADQAIIQYACKATNDFSIGEYTYRNAVALNTLRNDHGIAPRILPDDALRAIGTASLDVLASMANGDSETAKIYESFAKTLKLQREFLLLPFFVLITGRCERLTNGLINIIEVFMSGLGEVTKWVMPLMVVSVVISIQHVRVDILFEKMTLKTRALIEFCGFYILLLPVCVAVIWRSQSFVSFAWQTLEGSSTGNGIKGLYILKTLLFVMFLLLLIQGLSMALRAVLTLKDKQQISSQKHSEVPFLDNKAQLSKTFKTSGS